MIEGKTIKILAFVSLAIVFMFLVAIHNERLATQRAEAAHYTTTTKAADEALTVIDERLAQFHSDDMIEAFQTLGYERVLNNDTEATTFSKVDPYLDQTTAVRIYPATAHHLSRAIMTVYEGDSNTLKQRDLTQITQLETVLSWNSNHSY